MEKFKIPFKQWTDFNDMLEFDNFTSKFSTVWENC